MPAPERQQPHQPYSLAIKPLKGIVGYYSDLEVDALLAALPGGGPAVDLSAYATTEYVDGEIATVYSKAEVDQLLVALSSGGTIDLAGYAKVEELPEVFEQESAPVGKDGDLWLAPATGKGAEGEAVTTDLAVPITQEIQKVLASQPKTMTEPEVKSIVRTMIAGGKTPPPDFDWTPLVVKQGAGLIEAKQTNGVLLLRGELVFTYSSPGTYTTVRTLPASLPKPLVDCSAVVTGKENKVAFRFVSVTLTTSGDLNVVASGGKFTHVSFDGMIAYVC
jgi:hypothetical protein